MNKVLLLGRLGKDPEEKQTRYKNTMAKFSLATTDIAKGEDGKKEERTSWHNIVAFNRQAETVCQFLKKGSQVFIEGKLVHRSWEGDDGQKKYSTEIHAHTVTFCGQKIQSQRNSEPQKDEKAEKELKFAEDDIPF
jgi:single-strand DNA-binding protein